MQFQVPQFIETESKIVGPLTIRQFIYIAIGAGLSFLTFYLFNFFIAVMLIAVIATITAAFAFIRVGGQPMSHIFKSALGYYWNPRLYIWQKERPKFLEEPHLKELPKAPQRSATDPAFLRQKLSFASGLQNLWEKMATSKTPVAKREAPVLPRTPKKEKFEEITLNTGESEVARRVDYR